ncbi:MAG: RluA family pseudouridine synthase [Eubacteriales bacterium]|nr:RluA family pseudouridine synthase [Eubacteriales bacterium]
MLNILYEDEQIIVVWKPVGLESQSSRGFGADMVSEIQRHIHKLSPKGGEPYVGVIHRLDKPVSGVMVYAKEKKTAASLSKQVADHKMTKKYLAVLCGKPVDSVDNFVDYLLKDPVENSSRIVDKGINGAKRAELRMRALETKEVEPYGTLTLAEIELLTGRHHQIRVQMAGRGLPLWGDRKYNPEFGGGKQMGRGAGRGRMGRMDVGLSAYQIGFVHPGTGERMEFERVPDGGIFGEFVGRE